MARDFNFLFLCYINYRLNKKGKKRDSTKKARLNKKGATDFHGTIMTQQKHVQLVLTVDFRKQTRPFAINKVSTDAIIIFLYCESAANHNTCLYGERF